MHGLKIQGHIHTFDILLLTQSKEWEYVTQIHIFVHEGVGKFGPLRRLTLEGHGSQQTAIYILHQVQNSYFICLCVWHLGRLYIALC